jgi:prepilin-type N-terminal cleavage/methylation domain-containing protein/prepilin-type processing-associated H-X9-DG protein
MPQSCPPCARAGRAGYTLIELLVAVAIILVLVGLLIPAVHRVREAALRLECKNNLRQIGLAIHTHHETNGFFPTGGNGFDDRLGPPTFVYGVPAVGTRQRCSWMYQILPYLEESAVYSQPNAQQYAIKTYFCPSRRAPMTVPAGQLNAGDGLCDYSGSAWCPGDTPSVAGIYASRGIFRDNSQGCIRMSMVADGLSNTLMVGEKNLSIVSLGTGNDNCDEDGYATGWDDDNHSRPDVRPAQDSPTGILGTHGFGSRHADSFNAVFADGSVHAISYTISLVTLNQLIDICDGGVIDWGNVE